MLIIVIYTSNSCEIKKKSKLITSVSINIVQMFVKVNQFSDELYFLIVEGIKYIGEVNDFRQSKILNYHLQLIMYARFYESMHYQNFSVFQCHRYRRNNV